MNNLEERTTLVTTGKDVHRLRTIAASRPFTQQEGLEKSLGLLDFAYQVCETTLTQFVEFAAPYARQSNISAFGTSSVNDGDVWSLDMRGILTLMVGKEAYETLGIVGDRLPWKEWSDTHVVRLCMSSSMRVGGVDKCPTYGTKEAAALRQLDARRGPWKIMYHANEADGATHPGSLAKRLFMNTSQRAHAHIPTLRRENIILRDNQKDSDVTKDWEESVSALFEWVGMAALGSQRLLVGDRCDPYISVYEPPEPSSVGDLTIIRWTGFITATFLKTILEIILSPNISSPSFVSFTMHAIPTSPITYLPDNINAVPPLRAPRPDAEDTTSLMYVREDGSVDEAGCWWLLAESVGRWDKRWG